MATIIIENVPDLIVEEYGNKIQYSEDIVFFKHKRNSKNVVIDEIDEQALDNAIKSDTIRRKMSTLASKL